VAHVVPGSSGTAVLRPSRSAGHPDWLRIVTLGEQAVGTAHWELSLAGDLGLALASAWPHSAL
jgi:hypothetical protein